MSSHTDEEEKLASEIAQDLGFDIDDETVEEALDIADHLEESVETLYDPAELQDQSVGTMSDDEYNALLEVYEEPRQEGDGPLNGISVAVKDVIAARDLTMTCASKGCSFVPSYDATVVERLLNAGASLLRKANCDASAFGPTGEFSEFGRVINPAAEGRVPGGSSSGSAAAVAGGLVDATLGTDTGGSVRIPAACCGVVGMKPTHSLVPRYGFVDLAPSTDTIGPLARDVETAAKVLDAIAGPDLRDPSSSHVDAGPFAEGLGDYGELRVAAPASFLQRSSDDVREVMQTIMQELEGVTDVSVDEVELDLGYIDQSYPLTLAAEFGWLLRQSMVIRGQGTQYNYEWQAGLDAVEFNDHIALRVLPAVYLDQKTDSVSYIAGRMEAIALKRRILALFKKYDLLLTPAMRIVPPEYSEVTASEGMVNVSGNTAPFSLMGLPSVSVPAGEVNDVPVAAQIVAPDFEDARALQGAKLVEEHVRK